MSTNKIIKHTQWQEAAIAIDKLCAKFDAGTLTQKDRAVFVLGNANAGKSCFLEWYGARYKEERCRLSAAANDDFTSYSPVVTIKTPCRPDIPDLAHAIFVSIFGAVQTLPKQWHEGSYVKTAREQMEEIGCRLLLVDEAQQLTHIKNDEDRTQVIDFIKGFIDGVPCPIVFAGLPSVGSLLGDAQIRARTSDKIDLAFDWNIAEDRAGMITAIEDLCEAIGLGLEQKDSAELAVRMWAATQGGFGDIMRLLTMAKTLKLAPGRRDSLRARLAEAFTNLPREAIQPGSLGPFAEPIERHPLAAKRNPFSCPLAGLAKVWPVIQGRVA